VLLSPCVCVSLSGVLFSVGVCVCDLLTFLSHVLAAQVHMIAWMRMRESVTPNPTGFLTCHVLDTARGCPAAGMAITLRKLDETCKRSLYIYIIYLYDIYIYIYTYIYVCVYIYINRHGARMSRRRNGNHAAQARRNM